MVSLEDKQFIQNDSTNGDECINSKQKENNDDHTTAFVSVRKSKKGINLNDPEEFYQVPIEKSTIKRIMVLPTGGCCNMNYVLSHKNPSKKQQYSKKKNVHTTSIPCSGTITINIGPTMPFHLNPTMQNYDPIIPQPIEPKILDEDRFETKQQEIPLQHDHATSLEAPSQALESKFPHVTSREQRIIDFETPSFQEETLTYTTKYGAPPKIKPFKSFWNCLTCKRNKRKSDEVYLPSIMTRRRHQNRGVIACPTYSHSSKSSICEKRLIHPVVSRTNVIPSRLSTIAESEPSSQNLTPENETKL